MYDDPNVGCHCFQEGLRCKVTEAGRPPPQSILRYRPRRLSRLAGSRLHIGSIWRQTGLPAGHTETFEC